MRVLRFAGPIVGVGLSLVLAAGAVAAPKADLTVMSRNLYLGADIITLAAAPDIPSEQANAKRLHAIVDQTNFPLRAKAIAAEIKRTKPDVIGLQEVARFYRGPDGVHDNVTNATTPLYDFLAILQREIRAVGLRYRVASDQIEIDVEVPSDDGYDIRLKMGNTVLVRAGKGARVKVLRDRHGTFSSQLTVTLADQTLRLSRGYAGIEGRVAGKRFLFLDPHAEAYSPTDAAAQMTELLRTVATSRTLPTILAGDFNSDPSSSTAAGAYTAATDAGFVDTGRKVGTCCQDETLDNPQSKLTQWIDHVMVRPRLKVVRSQVVGNLVKDRIGGLWPSDHAGLVVKLRLR